MAIHFDMIYTYIYICMYIYIYIVGLLPRGEHLLIITKLLMQNRLCHHIL